MIIRQNVESAGSLRVLHVDDDASILEVSKNILTLEGKFEIDFACCADEAFEKLQEQKYDVIVSDYEMPGKNGLDFLKELKDKQISIPFILFTGKGREEVAVKALNLGADGYYNKQGNPETVYGELVHGITMAVAANKTKLALNESQEKFQKVFDSSTVGIAVFNMHKDKIVDCNKSFEQLSGYPKQEIVENQILTLRDMSDPENRKLLFSELLKVGHAEKKQLEMVTRSGEIKLVDACFSSVEIDGAPHSICNVMDVTKSRATEEALREMQVLMNSTINSTEDMIWSVSAEDFTLLTFNKATSDYFLRTQNLQIKAGMSSEEIMPTKDLAERWIQLNKRALREGTFSIEYRTLIEPRILEMVFNVMKQGERTFGIAVFARDITERKKAEEALQESEDKYRELVSRLPEMVFEIDTQGKVVFVNKRAYELTGYSEDELAKGFNSLFLVAPEDRER